MARTWRCYENGCRAPLGTIVQGELVLDKDSTNVAHINTEGAILNVTCSVCGRVNRWVPKDSDLIDAVMNTHLIRALIYQVSKIWSKGIDAFDDVESDEDEE